MTSNFYRRPAPSSRPARGASACAPAISCLSPACAASIRATNKLVDGDEARIRQAFLNMKTIVAAAGGSLRDAVRLVVYVTDMDRYRPLVNKIQEEFWGGPPYPPRTIVEVSRLNQDDIVEVEGTFFCPLRSAG